MLFSIPKIDEARRTATVATNVGPLAIVILTPNARAKTGELGMKSV